MVTQTLEYNGRYYAGIGDDNRSAHSDACARIVVDAILSYGKENGVYPLFSDFSKELKRFVNCIHYTVIKRYLFGGEETMDLSIKYNGRSFLGTGTSSFQAKFNACLNAAKVSQHLASNAKTCRVDSPQNSAPKMTNFLSSYPDYKSYESYKQNQAIKRLPHPADILTTVLKVKPNFSKLRILGDICVYYTKVGGKEYLAESDTKGRGSFESGLTAVLDICKDPQELAKVDRYMATLQRSNNDTMPKFLMATEAKTSVSKLAASKNTVPSVNSLASSLTCPAPDNQTFIEAYPAYKSYDSFVEEQRVKDVPHPTKILEEILQKKPTFEQVKAFGIFGARMVIYKIRVEDHLYQSHSNVDHIGKFECALNAVVNLYKDLSEREKINQYMATLNSSDILETYPAYKSYESFKQKQKSDRILHPAAILSDVLKKRPVNEKITMQDNFCIYITKIGDKKFSSESNVKGIGSYESSLKAFLDVCKDPAERAKFDRYMATLTASKKEVQANQSTWEKLLYAEAHSTPSERQTIKNRIMRHNRRVRDSAISDLSVNRMGLGQNAEQQRVDRVRNMVLEKYVETMKDRFVEYLPFKVIAGFVMERTEGQLEVVSVATGTKTVHGQYLNGMGAVVNDSHAEVLARRGLVSFFYAELGKALEGGESIFSLSDMECEYYKLKEGTKFHLYISKPPCGDACVTMTNDSKTAGKLRIKTECEEGFKKVPENGDTLTWDGIVCGQKLLTMSCSDKIARWNVLGLQGCLLSALVQPIYLSSLIIGSKLKKAHVERAIAGRLDSLRGTLAAPFKLNQPEVFQTSDPDPRLLSATTHCVNWTRHHNSVEILAGLTGRPLNEKGVSHLSKQSFLREFEGLASKIYEGNAIMACFLSAFKEGFCRLSIQSILKAFKELVCKILCKIFNIEHKIKLFFEHYNYGEIKNKIVEYQSAKQLFFDMCLERGMGKWVKKPEELNEFYLQLSN